MCQNQRATLKWEERQQINPRIALHTGNIVLLVAHQDELNATVVIKHLHRWVLISLSLAGTLHTGCLPRHKFILIKISLKQLGLSNDVAKNRGQQTTWEASLAIQRPEKNRSLKKYFARSWSPSHFSENHFLVQSVLAKAMIIPCGKYPGNERSAVDSQERGLDCPEVLWLALGFFCLPPWEIQSQEDALLWMSVKSRHD